MRANVLRALVVGVGVTGVTACWPFLQTDDTQCATTDDCRARGASFADTTCVASVCVAGAVDGGSSTNPATACFGHMGAPPTPPAGNVSITMSFYDEVSPTTQLSGITVTPCGKLDVTCAAPVASAATSDDSGNATLQIPAGFDGYLEMNGPTTVPSLWYFSPAPVADASFTVGLLKPTNFAAIAQTVGASIDPDAGHAFNFALDCTDTFGKFLAGMSFSSNQTTSETFPFYFIDGLPDTKATATDTSGIGGFANLPTGAVTITDAIADAGVRAGSVSVLIRAGTITYSPIAPSP
jgi:hypothetical protein